MTAAAKRDGAVNLYDLYVDASTMRLSNGHIRPIHGGLMEFDKRVRPGLPGGAVLRDFAKNPEPGRPGRRGPR